MRSQKRWCFSLPSALVRPPVTISVGVDVFEAKTASPDRVERCRRRWAREQKLAHAVVPRAKALVVLDFSDVISRVKILQTRGKR